MLGIRIRNRIRISRIHMLLGLLDPFSRGLDPDPYAHPDPDPAPDHSLFLIRCWADWNNACKINFFYIFFANLSLKIMCLRVSYKKFFFFASLKSLNRSRIQSWIRIRIWIHLSEVRNPRSGFAPKCHGYSKQILQFFLYLTHRKKEDTYKNMKNLSGLKIISKKVSAAIYLRIAYLALSPLYNTNT